MIVEDPDNDDKFFLFLSFFSFLSRDVFDKLLPQIGINFF